MSDSDVLDSFRSTWLPTYFSGDLLGGPDRNHPSDGSNWNAMTRQALLLTAALFGSDARALIQGTGWLLVLQACTSG